MKTKYTTLAVLLSSVLLVPNIAFGCYRVGSSCTGLPNSINGTCCQGGCVGQDGRVIHTGKGICITCRGCGTCATPEWKTYGVGIERRVMAYCKCNFCDGRFDFRCASGYYGNIPRQSSDCNKCPAMGNNIASSNVGSKVITECYIPTTTIINDAKGTQHFSSNCMYTM